MVRHNAPRNELFGLRFRAVSVRCTDVASVRGTEVARDERAGLTKRPCALRKRKKPSRKEWGCQKGLKGRRGYIRLLRR